MPSPVELFEPFFLAIREALGSDNGYAGLLSLHMCLALVAERSTTLNGGSIAAILQRASAGDDEPDNLWVEFGNHICALRDGACPLAFHTSTSSSIPTTRSAASSVLFSIFSSFAFLFNSSFCGFSYATAVVSGTGFQAALRELDQAMAAECFVCFDKWPWAIGEVYATYVLGAARSASGSWYTSKAIATKMATECIDSYRRNDPSAAVSQISCIDPSSGTGSLLIASMDYLNSLSTDESIQKSTIIARCAYGVDLDRGAIDVCRFCLMLRALPSPGQLEIISKERLAGLLSDLAQIRLHLLWADTLLSTRKSFEESSTSRDAIFVQKFRSAGHPILCWDDVWPEQLTASTESWSDGETGACGSNCSSITSLGHSTSVPGFACFLTNPPFLRKKALLENYRHLITVPVEIQNGRGVSTVLNEMLSSRFGCWETTCQANAFTMFAESSITFLRTNGSGIIISPGSLLVHASMKSFRASFFGPISEDLNDEKSWRRLLRVSYIGDLRRNAHLFQGAECYPVLLGFTCDPLPSNKNNNVIAERLQGPNTRKVRKSKALNAKKNTLSTAVRLEVVGGTRIIDPNILKSYPFWQISYSLAPLLSHNLRPLAACRPDREFLPLNALLRVKDRPRKDAYLSKIFQLCSFKNGNKLIVAPSSVAQATNIGTNNINKTGNQITVEVVISSSVGRHVNLYGRKLIKVNSYVEVPIQDSQSKTKTRSTGEHAMYSHPYFQIDEDNWHNKLTDADRALLSRKKIIFATMCAAPRCFYTCALSLPYCLPTAQFCEQLYHQHCSSELPLSEEDEEESRELFMIFVCSCINSEPINAWIMDVHGADSMNSDCLNMNLNLLNSIPIPFPSSLRQKFHFKQVDITNIFPVLNTSLIRSSWRSNLEETLRAMKDLDLMQVVATTGKRLEMLLERVFQRAESSSTYFNLKKRKRSSVDQGRDGSRDTSKELQESFVRSAHHSYSHYAVSGDIHIFTKEETDEEFWCNEIIDLACSILYFRR